MVNITFHDFHGQKVQPRSGECPVWGFQDWISAFCRVHLMRELLNYTAALGVKVSSI